MADIPTPTQAPLPLREPVSGADGSMNKAWVYAFEDVTKTLQTLQTVVQDINTRLTALEEASP